MVKEKYQEKVNEREKVCEWMEVIKASNQPESKQNNPHMVYD